MRAKGIALGASSNWMNNFIIGQVTPSMLAHMTYGTYIFFGVITALGAVFIVFFVPETKKLSLEEMDVVFGSEGVAAADFERQNEINREIGLEAALRKYERENGGSDEEGNAGAVRDIEEPEKEKLEVVQQTEKAG